MTTPAYYLVFDVESVGIHGGGFAVGYVYLDAVDGREIASGLAWCDSSDVPQDSPDAREWVKNHIPELPESCREPSVRAVREYFWKTWDHAAPEGAWLAADCPWPVEARFLLDCVADDPMARMWAGPYPLIDVASVRHAKGLDALGADERFDNELPMHNPLADARQSARLLLEALSRSHGGVQGGTT